MIEQVRENVVVVVEDVVSRLEIVADVVGKRILEFSTEDANETF